MFILTDAMRGLLGELASAGRMEMEISDDRLHVTVDAGPGRKGAPKVRACAASALVAAKSTKPRFGRKPGRKAKAEYRIVDGTRQRVHTFRGETLTVKEWAERYGVGMKTMVSRFRNNGTPETAKNRSKSDRTSLKAKLGGAK